MRLVPQNEPFHVVPITDRLMRVVGVGQEIMTLVEGEEYALLFDTGTGYGNIRALAETLTDKPVLVVISHAHPDHLGGMACFEEAYLHPAEMEAARQPLTSQERASCTDMLSMQTRGAHANLDPVKIIAQKEVTLHPVEAGYVFHLGGTDLIVEELPGHTRGSIVLVNIKDRYALTGDAITRETLLGLPGAPSKEEFYENLKVFFEKYRGKIDIIMPGHGGALPDPFAVVEGNLDAIAGTLSGQYSGDWDPRHVRSGKPVYRAKPELGSRGFTVGLEGYCRDGMIGNVLYFVDRPLPGFDV